MVVKSKSGKFIGLSEKFNMQYVNVTYLPQQIIIIRDQVKKFPLTTSPLTKKASYLSYKIFEQNKPMREVELLVQKELLGDMKELLPDEDQNRLSAHHINKVVRMYQKMENSTQWTPILTIPEQNMFHLLKDATIHPDGTIHL